MKSRLALIALVFCLVSCGSIPESQTQGGMNRQAAADAQREDTDMKAVYAKLTSQLQGQDLAELKASQKAFEEYRATESLAAGGEARGGTMEPLLRFHGLRHAHGRADAGAAAEVGPALTMVKADGIEGNSNGENPPPGVYSRAARSLAIGD